MYPEANRLDRSELVRKFIHLLSAVIPILYWFYFDRDTMLKSMIVIALFFLCAEYSRLHFPLIRNLFMKVFGPALRKHEHHQLTGATYIFSSAALTIFLFPKEAAVPALAVLAIADTFAALVGIPLGRHRFLAKSIEGSATFFIVTCIILYSFQNLNPILMIAVALFATLVEASPKRFDDNFLIPLTVASMLFLLQMF